MVRIEWDNDWEAHLERDVERYMKDVARSIYEDMVATAPKKTGRLVNDLDWEVVGTTARIGAKSVDYAYYVEVGTRPHKITPDTKQGLSWPGAAHPVNSVNHPGTVGTHFMRKALYKAR